MPTAVRVASPINPLTGKVRANVPRPPTTAEMQARLQDMLPGLRVYNPSDQWLQPEVHGITNRWIPPDLGGAVDAHPVTGIPTVCDGIAEIRGRILTQKDSSGKVISGQDAASVVSYIVGSEQWGQLGIVFLPGTSPEEDDKYKEIGRQVWMNFQKEKDDQIVSRRMEFKSNWEKNPAKRGTPCPPPSEVETAAIERQQLRTKEKKFVYSCDVTDCPGFAVNEWERFANHMKLAHDRVVKREQFDAPVSGFGPAVEKAAAQNDASIASEALRQANLKTAAKVRAAEPEDDEDDYEDDDEDVRPPVRTKRRG